MNEKIYKASGWIKHTAFAVLSVVLFLLTYLIVLVLLGVIVSIFFNAINRVEWYLATISDFVSFCIAFFANDVAFRAVDILPNRNKNAVVTAIFSIVINTAFVVIQILTHDSITVHVAGIICAIIVLKESEPLTRRKYATEENKKT